MTKSDTNPNISDLQFNTQLRASDVFGFPFFQTVTAVPTTVPRNAFEQLVIVFSGGIYQLYIYETASATWKAALLT